jgi:pimeloyl-ACP methyl ester carboxylesterase
MATFVLVHGGFVGGWDWTEFARRLRVGDNEVYTPTLTGLGERVHLGTRDTNLSTHIQDIVNVLEYEDLRDVVLTGHSYGGMVISGVATRVPERIAHLVFIDAMLPRDGQSAVDVTGGMLMQDRVEDGFVLRPPPPELEREEVLGRKRWVKQPLATFEEKLRISTPLEKQAFTRTFIFAAKKPASAPMMRGEFAAAVARVRTDAAWRFFEVQCGHAVHWQMPDQLAKILLELA